jgi:hypothetical protein
MVATTFARRGVGEPVRLFSGILLAEPLALPGYSWLLSVRNRRVYDQGRCLIQGLVTGISVLCCTLIPRPDAPILACGVSVLPAYTVHSAHTFVLGFLKVLFPELPLPSTTFHVTYPLGLD